MRNELPVLGSQEWSTSPFSQLVSAPAPFHSEVSSRLADLVGAWQPDVVDRWESDGHLPADAVPLVAATGLIKMRWELGRLEGLPVSALLAGILAQVSGGLALAVTLHSEAFVGSLVRHGKSDYQRDLLGEALSGQAVGCLAVTEPTGGSDLADMRSVAVRTPGGWRISGEKRYISNAGRATHAIVLLRVPDDGGEAAFVMPLSDPGVEVVGYFKKLGTNSCDAAHLRFEVELGNEHLLGRADLGRLIVSRALDLERLAVAAQVIGGANQALRLTRAFARSRRKPAGRVMDYQAVRHRLATSQVQVWSAESLLDSAMRSALETPALFPRHVAAVKLHASRTAATVIDECIQIFGGRGYTANFPLERMWRDVRLARIGGGTDEVMLELISAALDRPDAPAEERLAELDANDVASPE